MISRWILTLVAIVTVALVVLTFIYPQQMISPGALISAHQDLNKDCFACHAPLRGPEPVRCISCHAVAGIGLHTTRGAPVPGSNIKKSFHQELIEQDCMACHSDHAGLGLAHSHKTFTHVLLKTQVREQCASCHSMPVNEMHKNLTESCSQCHSSQAWKPATFDHNKYFRLDSDHNTACVTCHVNNVHTEFTCFGCHEHTLDKIRREHEEEGISNFDNCVECHHNAHDEPGNEGGLKEGSGEREENN